MKSEFSLIIGLWTTLPWCSASWCSRLRNKSDKWRQHGMRKRRPLLRVYLKDKNRSTLIKMKAREERFLHGFSAEFCWCCCCCCAIALRINVLLVLWKQIVFIVEDCQSMTFGWENVYKWKGEKKRRIERVTERSRICICLPSILFFFLIF